MTTEPSASRNGLLDHVVLPVANVEDARATARALRPYQPVRVTALHVVEKGAGVPDKIPVEHSEAIATEAFAAIRDVFPEAEDQTAYARDIVSAIFETANEVGASAVVFRPRSGGRLTRFLSGDLSLRLVTNAECPVISLPRENPSSE